MRIIPSASESFMPVSRIARLAVAALLLTGARSAHAQATTTALGNYILCRTTVGGNACFEIGLTTAARVNGGGVRDGTTGIVTARNLQGAAVVGAGGQTIAASNVLSVLTSIEFVTPGCLPGLACGIGDYFDGIAFGAAVGVPTVSSATGPVAGTVTNWTGTATKDPFGGISMLVFNAPSTSDGFNLTTQGLGGCTAGTGTVTNVANRLATSAFRTCDAQNLTGTFNLSFSTSAIFDPTFFWAANVRFVSETTPGSGNLQSFYCGIGANRRAQAFSGGNGSPCSSSAAAASAPAPASNVVPEPSTIALLGAGLAGLLVVQRRRRTA